MALPISLHRTGLQPGASMSLVRRPASSAAPTAASMAAASASRSKLYFNSMAADRMVPMGFALSCPAMSGAEPWIGSYRPRLPWPSDEEGIMPMEPVIMLASSDKMSPNMFSVTSTSNWLGSFTICMAALSTRTSL